ncbi:MAG: hypothetical protein M5R40_25940 [Anaerolineae bacterium]|nr:hypothetical protein [Anaerolineae bacterium]
MTPDEAAAIRAQVEADRAADLDPYRTGQKNAQGRVICGARRRLTTMSCQSMALFPNGRCRLHGGKTPAGVASPNFKHGRYSKHLPANLLDRYQAALADADLRALDDEIALLYAPRPRCWTGWARARDSRRGRGSRAAHAALVQAAKAGRKAPLKAAVDDLGAAIAQADTERDTWNQLLALIERRRKLVESKARVEALGEQAVAARELMALAAAQLDIIRRHVQDRDALAAIAAEFRTLFVARGPAQ